MAKRKKYPKLPNGYGSIKYLGKGRRNPYGVYPPVVEFTLEGVPVGRKALCYVDDWMKGFAVLTAYKAGTYVPGMELELPNVKDSDTAQLAQRILADYSRFRGATADIQQPKTFSEVYAEFYNYKYERDKSRQYSKSSIGSTKAAYKNCSALHDLPFCELRLSDLQTIVDQCPLKHSSLELIVSLFHQMYEYALAYEIVDRDYSAAVKINREDDDEHGVPFTFDELETIWKHQEDDVAAFILIMCYSGYRIAAYKSIEVNLDEKYFHGGIKTKTSKNRTVPIHSAIFPLTKRLIQQNGKILSVSVSCFRERTYAFLDSAGIEKHTPHDCRHTFSALCQHYKVQDDDRRRMLGHSFGNDISNSVYSHRSLEDLRLEIEKIKV